MKSNNIKNKNSQKAQIIKNKDNFCSIENSQQLWASNRFSHTVSRSQMLENPSRFDIQKLLHIFTQHYMMVEACFKQIGQEFTRLQSKLADCYGRFNAIQWKLNRQMHEINQSKSLNDSLIRINKEIEEKLEMVKNDYEQLKRRRYVNGMEKKIEELQQSVHKMELQKYRSKLNKQDVISFEDNLDRLEEVLSNSAFNRQKSAKIQILSELILDLIKFLRAQPNISVWIQAKIRENIDLKFQILKNEYGQQ